MNKTELIDAMAEVTDLTKAQAEAALNATTDTITKAMQNDDPVVIIGFGSFSVRERAARTGRNPQTGAEIQIAASKNVGFKAGKKLKERMQLEVNS